MKIIKTVKIEEGKLETPHEKLDIPISHRCVLIPYGNEEKRCVKCGYIA